MARSRFLTLAATTTLLGAAACSLDNSNGPNAFLSDLAFSTAPAGLDLVSSSYAPSDSSGMPWGGPGRGRGGGPGMGGFMGGGLGDAFIGGAAPGRGPHGGPFGIRIDDSCVYSAGTGDLTCGPTVKNGLTVTSIYTIKNAAGAAQSAIDSLTTNSVRVRTAVTGTATRSREGSVTATVNNSGDRTVTGLAAGSTQRTVNGTSQGNETANGTNRDGKTFSSVRTAADTTTGLVIPVSATTQTYPTAGTVTRRMKVIMTIDGTSSTRERREVITYDGTATAKLQITENGATKNCTVALPRGRPSCS
ncbi:hypothetical protein [Gemmatimonas groenlandica]|uniref:Uncharacterized protein n=1 Tax=Gemmatimonas groenlandica TaxID=2732249 RepID=A0A6M4IHG2_9BACT|nr:hypothetical protein [Gemmatimonas groenlandica]QJR34010.1 hypothetical protein HKW67_22215 [Gemmatimonas groenlandica]